MLEPERSTNGGVRVVAERNLLIRVGLFRILLLEQLVLGEFRPLVAHLPPVNQRYAWIGKRLDQPLEPVLPARDHVGAGHDEILGRCAPAALIERVSECEVGRANPNQLCWKPADDVERAVGRPGIDHDHLRVAHRLAVNVLEQGADMPLFVEASDDDRDPPSTARHQAAPGRSTRRKSGKCIKIYRYGLSVQSGRFRADTADIEERQQSAALSE